MIPYADIEKVMARHRFLPNGHRPGASSRWKRGRDWLARLDLHTGDLTVTRTKRRGLNEAPSDTVNVAGQDADSLDTWIHQVIHS